VVEMVQKKVKTFFRLAFDLACVQKDTFQPLNISFPGVIRIFKKFRLG
jgi:hypothetical protein